MEILVVVALVAASLLGSALIFYAVRQGTKAREALKAMAAKEGWQFEYRAAGAGRGTETIISDPREGWSVTMYFHSSSNTGSSGGSGSTTRWTNFEAPDLAVPGMALIGPDIPEKTKQMADKMMGLMGGDLGRFFLNKITGGLGEEAQALRTVDSPGPGTLMATPEAEGALDKVRHAPELNNARAGKNEAQQPIVMRGSFGLRLRVAKYLKKEDDVRAFIALGRALADNLRS